jgi:hypothetical protein
MGVNFCSGGNAHKGVHNLPRLKEIIRLSTPFLKEDENIFYYIFYLVLFANKTGKL